MCSVSRRSAASEAIGSGGDATLPTNCASRLGEATFESICSQLKAEPGGCDMGPSPGGAAPDDHGDAVPLDARIADGVDETAAGGASPATLWDRNERVGKGPEVRSR
jgi:hypothetical protein